MTPAGRVAAEALDAQDPLAAFRDRFVIADDGIVYLDGNSLGRLPRTTIDRLRAAIEQEWGTRLIRGWDEGWMDLPQAVGDAIGAAVLGAAPGQVIVGDSTTVCLYKLASAALDLRPGRTKMITDADDFPTDRYVLEGLAHARGMELVFAATSDAGITAADLAGLIDADTALLSLSHVDYRSGALADMAQLTAVAHDAGALALWDLSHSAGAVPIALDADAADLAVGCTYKYLCGGPGAPAFMYARAGLQPALRQPIWGWLGRRDPFAMAPGYLPAEGIGALLSGTPPVLALTAVQEGVKLVAEAGVDAIRAKGIALTEYAIEFVDQNLAAHGVTVGSPRDSSRRGAHVALRHEQARELCAELRAHGVIPDFREPDVIRIGLSPLTTRFADVYDGLEILRALLDQGGVSESTGSR